MSRPRGRREPAVGRAATASRPRVVVVGAGFAGLSAAVHLAASGAAVTLLERQATPGGKAGEWHSGGFRFDTGPTLLTLPEVVEATFAAAGRRCPIELAPAAGPTRYLFPSGRAWDVDADAERTMAGLEPAEADAYRGALAHARALYEAAAPVFVHGPAPRLPRLIAYGLRHGRSATPGRRLPQLLDALGVRGDLRTFFLRFATYFGADPFLAPAVLHSIAWVELGLGTRRVVGGMHALARALERTARDLGVDVRYGCAVRRLVRRGGRVREVVTDTGPSSCDAVACDAVVLAVDATVAMAMLGRQRRREAAASLSGLVWLAGVRGGDDRLRPHTVLFPRDYEAEFRDIRAGRHPRDPTLSVTITSRSEPSDAPAGHENRFVMANAPALVTPEPSTPRREAEEAEGRRAVVHALARHGFDPAGRVVVERWLPPAAFAALGHRGSLYGAAPHGVLATLRPANAVAGVPNAALAGGTVHPGGGVPLALLSGRYAAEVVAGRLGLAPCRIG